MDHRRLSLADIIIGEPLLFDVYGEDRKLLLRKGQVITSERQVEGLVERGLYVDAQLSGSAAREKTDTTKKKQEIPSVLRFINLANKRLERLLYSLSNETDAQAKILEVVKAVTYATTLNPDIALACVFLNQDAGNYAVRHGIDTATVAMVVARAMRKTPEEINSIMAAALTMNIGMLRYQDQLETKLEPLSEKESALIKNHPQESVALLKQAGIADPDWLSYVALHHENENGTGYPIGAGVGAIPQNAKILTLADHYCACISSRTYRKTLMPGAALRDVFLAGGKASDPMLSAYFIKELGTYPPGSFVRLENGEVGVVTGKGAAPTTPVVHALVGPRGAPLSFPIKRDTTKQLYAIRDPMPDNQASLRFSLQQLWGEEAAM